jgi:hypothetical protein
MRFSLSDFFPHNISQEARQEVMNRAMELSEVQEGVKEAENAAKVCLTRISPIRLSPIRESPLYFRHWRMSYWRNSRILYQ